MKLLINQEKDNGVVTSKPPSSSKALDEPTLKAENKITSDTQVPLITITQSDVDGRKGTLTGFVRDNIQIAEVLIDGNVVSLGNDGSFEWSGFVPATGKDITVEAIDSAALSSTKVIRLERGQIQQPSGPRFADLDPTIGKRVKRNDNGFIYEPCALVCRYMCRFHGTGTSSHVFLECAGRRGGL